MNKKLYIGSDLDGTVRRSLEPFNSARDKNSSPVIRFICGILATIFARRINKEIRADIYITGSPSIESLTTRLWLLVHGLKPNVYGNKNRSRFLNYEDPDMVTSIHKTDILNRKNVDIYYEDSIAQGEVIKKGTRTKIIYVDSE